MAKNKKKNNSKTSRPSNDYYGTSKKNSKMAKILIIVLAVILALSMAGIGTMTFVNGMQISGQISGVTDIENRGELPELTAGSAYLIDADTGQVLFDKNGYAAMFPASTTKIMTAYLTIKNLDINSEVTIDAEAAGTDGSAIDLKEGEIITVKNLLYALMLFSANDAAVALAKSVSGSVSAFADLMNDTAVEMGATGTRFVTPNGLPDPDHYTTAHDLACITKFAMTNESFREIVATREYTIPATNMSEERELINSNRMLWDNKPRYDMGNGGDLVPNYYSGTIGVKTGHTNEAGSCLVSCVERNGHTLIGVTLGSEYEQHYLDMIKLMDYGYNNYSMVRLATAVENSYTVKVKHSETKKLGAVLGEDVTLTLPSGSTAPEVTTEETLEKKYEAPIKKGDVLGSCNIYLDGSLYTTVDIVAAADAPYKKGIDFLDLLLKIVIVLAIILVILIILLLIVRTVNKNRARKRRVLKARQEAAAKLETERKIRERDERIRQDMEARRKYNESKRYEYPEEFRNYRNDANRETRFYNRDDD